MTSDKIGHLVENISSLREMAEVVDPRFKDILLQSSHLLDEYKMMLANKDLRRVDL